MMPETTTYFGSLVRDYPFAALAVQHAAATATPVFRWFGWEWVSEGGVPSEDAIREQYATFVWQMLQDRECQELEIGRLRVRAVWNDEGPWFDFYLNVMG